MSQPSSIAKNTQSAVTRDETAAATAMKRDILHSVDAAGFLESAPDAMVIVDEQGRIVAVNTLAEQLFGYRREELIGELFEMLVTDRSRNRLSELRKRYGADRLPWTVGADLGLCGLRKDGKELSIEISLSPLGTSAKADRERHSGLHRYRAHEGTTTPGSRRVAEGHGRCASGAFCESRPGVPRNHRQSGG